MVAKGTQEVKPFFKTSRFCDSKRPQMQTKQPQVGFGKAAGATGVGR
jgi:hypothetical protein